MVEYNCVAVSTDDEALASVVCPATPRVPVTKALPNVAPVAEKFVVDALVAVRAEINPLVNVSPVPDIPVVDALVAVSEVRKPLVKVNPVPERLVVLALVENSDVAVSTDDEALASVV